MVSSAYIAAAFHYCRLGPQLNALNIHLGGGPFPGSRIHARCPTGPCWVSSCRFTAASGCSIYCIVMVYFYLLRKSSVLRVPLSHLRRIPFHRRFIYIQLPAAKAIASDEPLSFDVVTVPTASFCLVFCTAVTDRPHIFFSTSLRPLSCDKESID